METNEMTNSDNERAEVIRRYMREKYGYEPDMSEINQEPRHERVWSSWIALAYFRENNYFERVEDAPPGIDWIYVMDGQTLRNYEWRVSYEDGMKSQWRYFLMNVITRKDCEVFYGT